MPNTKTKIRNITTTAVVSLATLIAISGAMFTINTPNKPSQRVSQAAPAPYKNGSISGFVTYDKDNNLAFSSGTDTPAANMPITLNGADNYGNTQGGSATTDATGKYTISDLPDGTYQIQFFAAEQLGENVIYDKTGSNYDMIISDQKLVLNGTRVSSITDANFGLQYVPVITTPTNNSTAPAGLTTISGTGEPNSVIDIYEGTTKLPTTATVTTNATGSWTATLSTPLSAGSHAINATQTLTNPADSSKLTSLRSPDTTVIISGAAVTVPATTINTPAPVTNANKSAYPVSGTCVTGNTVNVLVGTVSGTATCVNNAFSITLDLSPLPDGPIQIKANQSDTATPSNKSADTTASTTKSTASTSAPVITTPSANSTVTSTTPAITGTGTAGNTITVKEGATTIGTATVGTDGTWSVTPATPLTTGSHTVIATQSDGTTTSPNSNPQTFTVQPTATVVTAPTVDTPVAITPANATAYPVSGTCVTGNVVTVMVGTITKTVTCVGGTFSTTLDVSSLPDGANIPVKVNQKDANGTVSPDTNGSTTKNTTPATVATPVITTPANSSTTTTGTPAITGTGTAGNTVTVKEGTITIGTATVGADGKWTITPTTAFGDGSHSITATQSDGTTTSSPANATFSVNTGSTTTPAAPTINTPAPITTANQTAYPVSGTCVNGNTVNITVGSAVKTVTCVNGVFSATLDVSPVADSGSVPVTVSQTNSSNVKSPDTTLSTKKDTKALAPVISTPTNGSTTTSTTPTITGTAEAGATVTVKDGNNIISGINPIVADAAGNWSFTPDTALTSGSHSLTATQKDPSGNVSPASTPTMFTISPTAAAAPVINPPVAITPANATAYPVSGTCVTGNSVNITIGTIVKTITCVGGTFSTTLDLSSLPDGANIPVKVNQNSNGGTPSADTTASVKKDTSTTVPVITSPTNNSTATSTTPTITGTGEAGATVTIKEGTTTIGTSVVATDGSWSVTPSTPFSAGSHTITAGQTDPSGNISTTSSATFMVNGAAATVLAPTVTYPTSGTNVNNQTPNIKGTGQPNATITIKNGAGTTIATTTVNPDGTWSVNPTVPFDNGSQTISVNQTTPAGTVSPITSITFMVNNGSLYANGTISGSVSFDTNGNLSFDTTDAPAPNISFNMTGSDNYGRTFSKVVITDANGKYSVTGLADGTYDLILFSDMYDNVYDKTGLKNDGIISNQKLILTGTQVSSIIDANFGLSTDSIAPTAPTIQTPTSGSTSANTKPTITGMGEAGATVTVMEGTTIIGTATVGTDGKWTVTPSADMSNGSHTIAVTQKDKTGNTSPATTTTFTVNNSVPAAPTVNTLPAITPNNQTAYPVSGTCVTGNLINITIGTITKSVTCTNGTYSLTVDVSSLPDNSNVPVTVNQTNPTTNIKSADATASVIKDIIAPNSPVITSPTTGSNVANTLSSISGTGVAGNTITVKEGTTTIGTATVGANGNWVITPTTALSVGSHTINVTQIDMAGNVSTATTITFTVGNSTPTVTTNTTPNTNTTNTTNTPITNTTNTPNTNTNTNTNTTPTPTVTTNTNTTTTNTTTTPTPTVTTNTTVSTTAPLTVRTGGVNGIAAALATLGAIITGFLFFVGFKKRPQVDMINKK